MTADEKKIQELHAFVQEVKELLNKYPHIKIYGDRGGYPVADTTIGDGYSCKTVSAPISLW